MLDIENCVDSSATDDEFEEVIMGLIINSGQARSIAYAALKKRSKVILHKPRK